MPTKPTIAELLAAKSAAKTAEKKPNGPGLVLRAGEPEATSAVAASPGDPPPDLRRSLASTYGEAIPATPKNATTADLAWHSALQGFDTELCLMQDPDPRQERGWLAVRRTDKTDEPILLFALPLYPHPKTKHLPNEPF